MPRRRVSEMDEAQRRAVFARLHAGGGGRRGPASGSASARQSAAYDRASTAYPPLPPEPTKPPDVRTRENVRAYANWVAWQDDLKSGKYGPEVAAQAEQD